MTLPVVLWVRMAALVAITSALVGGAVWSADLLDRSDGDDLRWGVWHNPFMGFDPFCEIYLDISMWVLWGCSAASGLGGLMLLADSKWGVRLVAWQALLSMATNGIVVFFVALMALGVLALGWTGEALALRTGSVLVDLALWRFLKSSAVTDWMSGLSRGRQDRRRS